MKKINTIMNAVVDALINKFQKVRKNKFFYRYIFWYFIIVFSFATAYWLMFNYNSTSFLIADQYNKNLNFYYYYDSKAILEEIKKAQKDYEPFSIKEFYDSIKPDYNSLKNSYDSLMICEQQYDECMSELNRINDESDDIRGLKIQEYKDNQLRSYKQRIDSLDNYLKGKDSVEMIISGKYIELSKLKLDYANKNAEVCSYVLEHYGDFLPDSLKLRIEHLSNEYVRFSSLDNDYQHSVRITFIKIQDFKNSFHKNRVDNISYWDFVYYSICVSTTVSFGDIAPNNGWARFVSILELLICIALIGYIISLFKNK